MRGLESFFADADVVRVAGLALAVGLDLAAARVDFLTAGLGAAVWLAVALVSLALPGLGAAMDFDGPDFSLR